MYPPDAGLLVFCGIDFRHGGVCPLDAGVIGVPSCAKSSVKSVPLGCGGYRVTILLNNCP